MEKDGGLTFGTSYKPQGGLFLVGPKVLLELVDSDVDVEELQDNPDSLWLFYGENRICAKKRGNVQGVIQVNPREQAMTTDLYNEKNISHVCLKGLQLRPKEIRYMLGYSIDTNQVTVGCVYTERAQLCETLFKIYISSFSGCEGSSQLIDTLKCKRILLLKCDEPIRHLPKLDICVDDVMKNEFADKLNAVLEYNEPEGSLYLVFAPR